MESTRTQLLIIGAGPGGYVCAIRAGQLGIKTIIVEAEKPGGTCLNVGCIPSKAVIHAADEFYKMVSAGQGASDSMGISTGTTTIDFGKTIGWKNGIVDRLNSGVSGLLAKANVQVLQGVAKFRDGKTVIVDGREGEVQVHCENVVIATGSEPVDIPGMPFSDHVMSSTGALTLTEVPKSLAVIGGGYIGLELGTAFAKLGSQVTIVESEDRVLSQYDEQLSTPVVKRLKHLGITLLTQTRASGYEADDAMLSLIGSDNATSDIQADRVLVTVGRRARLSGWGLEELSLTTENGFLSINENCQTSMLGVYAIGDVTGEPMLAHRAMAQGDMVARLLAGQSQSWDRQCIPAVCFTDPEIVTAGMSPDDARLAGEAFDVTNFPFMANGRAMTLEREDGFIRVVTQKHTNVILGIQAVGAGVSELSAAFSLAIEMGACAEDLAATVHAHPTMSEGLQEACLMATGYGLHL